MAEWMSIRAFARRIGVRHRAVQKAIEAGRITAVKRDADGDLEAVDAEAAVVEWAANTDPEQAARNGKFLVPPAGETPAGQALKPADDPSPAAGAAESDEFRQARIREANLRGELLTLDKLERLGVLVSAEEVEHELGEILGQLKTNMTRIADAKAQILAAETDPTRVHRVLSEEIRKVFDECSRRLADSVAGGIEERAPALP